MQGRVMLVPVLAFLLVVAMAVANNQRISVADTVSYHAEVREAVQDIPMEIDGWRGKEIELPEFALNLLRPNVIVHRNYVDLESGHEARLTFVHAKDARYLIDHYPPSCYPSFGWTYLKPQSTLSMQWETSYDSVPGAEFAFVSSGRRKTSPEIYVRNFIVLHQDGLHHDHQEVHIAAADFTRRIFGAAQMSVMLRATVPAAERDAIFHAMLEAVEPAVRAVLAER